MLSGGLIATPNVIDASDVAWFGRAVEAGLVTLERGGRFNTLDRPKPGGRWGLLSRSSEGGWYNAEYLPQIAAYARAVLEMTFPRGRMLFELPGASLQLDVAILADDGRVVVLGEAKRDVRFAERRVSCAATNDRVAGGRPRTYAIYEVVDHAFCRLYLAVFLVAASEQAKSNYRAAQAGSSGSMSGIEMPISAGRPAPWPAPDANHSGRFVAMAGRCFCSEVGEGQTPGYPATAG